MARHLYLRKANDDFVSHCKCDKADAWITSPGQMDCPWCGCGWLFICGRCSKAFTFAEAAAIDESWEDTGTRNVRSLYERDPEAGEIDEWVQFMKILLKGIRPGETYVYFDGYVVPATAAGVKIEGWHSRHELDFVPQVAAMTDPAISDRLLSARDYWQTNRIVRQDG